MEILKLKTRIQKTGRRANRRGWKRSGNWEAEPQTNSNRGTEKVAARQIKPAVDTPAPVNMPRARVLGVLEKERRQKGQKQYWERVGEFSIPDERHQAMLHDGHGKLCKHPKKNICRHLIVKLLKTRDNKKNVKSSQRKKMRQ